MATVQGNTIFNRADRFVEGWYWALPSPELARGAVKPLNLLGRELVLYRGEDGQVAAMDAYCPHMGAHLAQGRVEGTGLRCFFHDWRFEREGQCSDAPCSKKPPRADVRTWPVEEHLGMVWIWAGREEPGALPFVPELKDKTCDVRVGKPFVKECHPNVMLINAIDENHFNSVHNLPVDLHMAAEKLSTNSLKFSNTTRVPDSNVFTRLYGKLYQGPLTYSMCYHYATCGSVTVGPDLFHFHILFALRPLEGGRGEGCSILVTERRSGMAGRVFNGVVLQLTKIVGDYFAKGDTEVFRTIRFNFKTPTRADHAIIHFIQHCDGQQAALWESWERPQDQALALVGAAE